MFSQVSVCPQGGVLPQCMLGYTPWAGTPPRQVHPQAGTPPWAGTPWAGTPFPPAQCMLGYSQQMGDTHPTGMHSCSIYVSNKIHIYMTQKCSLKLNIKFGFVLFKTLNLIVIVL